MITNVSWIYPVPGDLVIVLLIELLELEALEEQR